VRSQLVRNHALRRDGGQGTQQRQRVKGKRGGGRGRQGWQARVRPSAMAAAACCAPSKASDTPGPPTARQHLISAPDALSNQNMQTGPPRPHAQGTPAPLVPLLRLLSYTP
jgi:hypothetical protein